MAIQIKYAQSYLQSNGQMTIDVLLSSTEPTDLVIGLDPMSSDATPVPIGPRFVICLPANNPCYSVRLPNLSFNDPFKLYVHRCISGPNCAGPSCSGFSTLTDASYTGTMVDYSGSVPGSIFGSPHPLPTSISGTCVAAPVCTFSTVYIPDVSVYIGKTYTLTASCKDSCGTWINCPGSGWSWSSDNPSVASVMNSTTQNSIVTGIATGTAHITVQNTAGVIIRNTVTVSVAPGTTTTYQGYTITFDGTYYNVKSPAGVSLGGYDTLDAAKARIDQAVAAVSVLTVTNLTAEVSTDPVNPGIRINVTATGSGMVAILVDGVRILEDGPLNPGTTAMTYTYIRQLTPGTRNICANGESSTGTVGNQKCISFVVPSPIVLKDSCLTVDTHNTPPFDVGENVVIYGLLEECGLLINPDINGANLTVKILADSTELVSKTVTTYVSTQLGENWNYVWNVPSGLSGKTITAQAFYYGSDTYKPVNSSKVIGSLAYPFTMFTDKTSVVDGDKLTIYGMYKPNTTVNIYYMTLVAGIPAPCKNHLTSVNTGSAGAYSTTVVMSVTVPGTIRIGACSPPAVGAPCVDCGDDYSTQTVDVAVSYAPPTPFTLSINKTSIISGDTVTFSGKYKPNTHINIYTTGLIKTHLGDTVTLADGTFSVGIKITSDASTTETISACPVSSVPGVECEVGGDTSNTVSLTITPPGVTPPPALKWKYDSVTNKCIQASDGKYDTQQACLDAQKKQGVASTGLLIGAAALGVAAIATMKKK